MFSKRSDNKELMDDLNLSNQALEKNLDELRIYNTWLGGKHTLIRALNKIFQKYQRYIKTHKISIYDLGCGAGDLLVAINKWANQNKLDVEIVGVDANPFMIAYAKKNFPIPSNGVFKQLNVLSDEFKNQTMDIVCLNSFCHHLSDEEFIKLFKQLVQQTRLAIIINDLRRDWLAYYLIKYLTKLLPFSYLAKNDAPLSVLRAFRRHELIELFKQAGITTFEIKRNWAYRWQIIIWCDKHMRNINEKN